MTDHSRTYIGAAFLAGILLTLGYKDLYPELVRLLEERRRRRGKAPNGRVGDEEFLLSSVRAGPPAIVDGVEGCIGNTPLLRIKSLSEATGCEILAKAEV